MSEILKVYKSPSFRNRKEQVVQYGRGVYYVIGAGFQLRDVIHPLSSASRTARTQGPVYWTSSTYWPVFRMSCIRINTPFLLWCSIHNVDVLRLHSCLDH